MCVRVNISFRLVAGFFVTQLLGFTVCVSTSHLDWLDSSSKHSCWALLCVKILLGLTVEFFVTQLLALLCVNIPFVKRVQLTCTLHECLTQHC